jgi:hypothetical protein
VVRFLLISLLAGCYHPALEDCVDTCGASHLCPDGLSCVAGYCTNGGTCSAPSDAPPMHDSTPAGCPAVPNLAPCATVAAPPVPPYCFAVCTSPATSMGANMFSSGSWHVAVILDAAEEAAAQVVVGAGEPWIGLLQAPGGSNVATGWHWIMQAGDPAFTAWASGQPDDGNGTEDNLENCGTITASGWVDEPCAPTNRAFLIEPF